LFPNQFPQERAWLLFLFITSHTPSIMSSTTADFGFTCVTCQLQFQSAALQREHFTKSDLHRYNAKRRVADLPAVSYEVFSEKIAERRTQLEAGLEQHKLACKACDKTFKSQNAYEDHLNSKRHRQNVLSGVRNMSVKTLMGDSGSGSGSDGEVAPAVDTTDKDDNESSSSPQEKQQQPDGAQDDAEMAVPSTSKTPASMPELDSTSCLFCPRKFNSLEVNLKHMSHDHAFYIPDAQYCIDVPGLLQQLGEDIAHGNICIWCGHGFGGHITGEETDADLVKRAQRGFHAVRKHMVDKSHCRIPWDTDDQRLEYSDHYDFTSTWAKYDSDGNKLDMEIERDDNAEWQDEDGSDIDESDDVVMDYSAIRKKTRTHDDDVLEGRLQAGEGDYELVLPSGARIGHRALKGIYKANMMREFCFFLSSCSAHCSKNTDLSFIAKTAYVDVAEPKDKVARLAAAMEAKAARKEMNSSALIPRKDGSSLPMVVARNAGEAKNARRDTVHVTHQKAWDKHALKVGKVHNSQKHVSFSLALAHVPKCYE
jgi:pre-60S factor REI1